MRLRRAVGVFGLTLLLAMCAGCNSKPTATEAIAEVDARIAKEGSLVFRSWNGEWIGMDCDTDMAFLPNQTIKMTEYGDAVSSFHGTYTVDVKGVVAVNFVSFPGTWPAMRLRKDSTSLLLEPTNGSKFEMGSRGGATIPSGRGSYWPFRPEGTTGSNVERLWAYGIFLIGVGLAVATWIRTKKKANVRGDG